MDVKGAGDRPCRFNEYGMRILLAFPDALCYSSFQGDPLRWAYGRSIAAVRSGVNEGTIKKAAGASAHFKRLIPFLSVFCR